MAAIGFNLIPLIGVVFWGWSAFALIFLYWMENLVIGVRTLGAMAASAVLGEKEEAVVAIGLGALFTVHYGMFCFVHGIFVLVLFGAGMVGFSPFQLAEAAQVLVKSEPGFAAGLASIVLWQFIQFALFVMRGEAATTTPFALMGAPYPRIIILHVTIIFGGFLLMLLNQPLAGLVLLVLIKAAFDVAEAMGKRVSLPIDMGAPGQQPRSDDA
jgi:hypothetical protein